MVNSKKQMFTVIGAFILIMLLGTTTYAFFNYTRTGTANTLVVGNIYMNHTQGDEITLLNEFPETTESARSRDDNTVTVEITGLNESDKDVYYKLLISRGSTVDNRTRIRDDLLRFDLIEVLDNNEEKYIIYNESFDTINNTVLVKDRIDAGTTSSISRTYKLRMWIDKDLLISDTDDNHDYTAEEYENLFASVKITAKGDLQNVYYYNSFGNAIDAVNAETYESEATRSTAKAGVYIDPDDNTTNLVMYDNDNLDTSYTLVKPVNINLYGYTLTDTETESEYIDIVFDADGTIENGVIKASYANVDHSLGIAFLGADGIVNNVDFQYSSSDNNPYFCVYLVSRDGSHLFVKNTKAHEVDIRALVDGDIRVANNELDGRVLAASNGHVVLEDTNLYNDDSVSRFQSGWGIFNYGTDSVVEVNNTRIFADSPGCYMSTDGNYLQESIGILNNGTLIFNSGYVFGTHSAIQTNPGSKLYVYGGTFESTDHGGFYFAQGPTGVAYIENATIRGINYPAEGKLRPNGRITSVEDNNVTYNLEEGRVSMYIGGDTNQNGESVYLVNCTIEALGTEVIVMRSSTPQQSIYMSGCSFPNSRDNQYIRMQRFDTMRLYLGSNNSFGLLNNVYNNSARVPFDTAREAGAIIDTNENYKGRLRPE